VRDATTAFENYDHTKALELAEGFFWKFTDDYLELVKERAYGQGGVSEDQQASAAIALRKALHVLLRLFAPFLPYATEEVWSWWQTEGGSIHRAAWPKPSELTDGLDASNASLLSLASVAVGGVRKAKSDAKVSMRSEVQTAVLRAPSAQLASLRLLAGDLRAVGRIWQITFEEGTELEMTDIVFAEEQSQ
jgi:valyl-tRNA synthetase